MGRIVYCTQGEEDWFTEKLGKVSASHTHEVMAGGKGITRDKYLTRLLMERLTGQSEETYQSKQMKWGTEQEPEARARYEAQTFTAVEQVGCVYHDSIEGLLASPDGLCGEEGMLEVKNRETVHHLEWFLNPNKKPDRTGMLQMQAQMSCTGRQWVDYVSYDSRCVSYLQYHCVRVHRDEKTIIQIEHEVKLFLEELQEKYDRLIKLA